MWEVVSYGERPYWEMTNQDVSTEILFLPQVESEMLCPLSLDCYSILIVEMTVT